MPFTPYFQRDGITVFHGNCCDVLEQLTAESFDLVLTDPPYLVGYTGRWDSTQEEIHGDSDPSWLHPAFSQVWRVLKADSLCLSFYGWPCADEFLGCWKALGFRPVSLFVFLKSRWGFGHFTRARQEQAYLLAKGHPPRPQNPISDVLSWEQESRLLHPNQKPLGAISKLISTYAGPGTRVLDPFCGSGTTLLAARSIGLPAVGIEIEERYCELIAMRLSQQVLPFCDTPKSAEQLRFE